MRYVCTVLNISRERRGRDLDGWGWSVEKKVCRRKSREGKYRRVGVGHGNRNERLILYYRVIGDVGKGEGEGRWNSETSGEGEEREGKGGEWRL